MERIKRLKILNSITGIKPANLIGTINKEGQSNLAIISSVVHLGSDPALIGFVMRPSGEVERHTLNNILSTEFYSINHIHESMIDQAHYTSAAFDVSISEFDACHLKAVFMDGFIAPYVDNSLLKIGLKLEEVIDIKSNGTQLIIGAVEALFFDEIFLDPELEISFEHTKSIGIVGLNAYYGLHKIKSLPYARVNELPDFN